MDNIDEFNYGKHIDAKLDKILYGIDINGLSKIEKARIVYMHLAKRSDYDYVALERTIKTNSSNTLQEIKNYLLYRKGICSSFAPVYRALLKKINVDVKVVVCDDGNPRRHMLNIIEDEKTGLWYFIDITRSALYREDNKEEIVDNFAYGYNRALQIGQKMLGVVPDYAVDSYFDDSLEYDIDAGALIDGVLYELPTVANESLFAWNNKKAM